MQPSEPQSCLSQVIGAQMLVKASQACSRTYPAHVGFAQGAVPEFLHYDAPFCTILRFRRSMGKACAKLQRTLRWPAAHGPRLKVFSLDVPFSLAAFMQNITALTSASEEMCKGLCWLCVLDAKAVLSLTMAGVHDVH